MYQRPTQSSEIGELGKLKDQQNHVKFHQRNLPDGKNFSLSVRKWKVRDIPQWYCLASSFLQNFSCDSFPDCNLYKT